MAISMSRVDHITPSSAELQPFHKIHCQEADCAAIFTNAGNYELHLLRHHKIKPPRDGADGSAIRLYYCPDTECIYSFKKGTSGRHFKHIKNLRQHFQKVHIKNFICERCGRTFPTAGQFKTHVEIACGKQFNCETCSWSFETKEALALHGKRKGHTIQVQVSPNTVEATEGKANKRARQHEEANLEQPKSFPNNSYEEWSRKDVSSLNSQNKDTQTNLFPLRLDNFTNTHVSCEAQTQFHDIETQTEQLLAACLLPSTSILENMNAIYHDTETQTDTSALASSDSSNVFDELQAMHHHDIETQTESTLQHYTSPRSNSSSGGGFFDQMLAQTPLTHMHTQTCDDYLLSELGLTDIQTQTNWTSFSDSTNATEHSNKHMYTTTSTSTSTTTTGFAHDELLVSTETQTSFTQCLLDSTTGNDAITADNPTTCTTGCGTGEDSNGSYVHLYNTQQTQTCDLLLGLFGSQENDLIAGFQSTYTQT